jgi:hypothetical protein
MRRRIAFGLFLFLIAGSLFAGSLQDKNYLVLTLLEKTPGHLESDADLKEILRAKQEVLRTCTDVACFALKMRFSDEEISRAAAALKRHTRATPRSAAAERTRATSMPGATRRSV